MGKTIIHCGEAGTGATSKVCNNLILAIQMIAVSEGAALGERLGIDPKVLQRILSESKANCWATNVNYPIKDVLKDASASRNFDGGFQSALMRKDMILALDSAKAVGAELSFAWAAHD